MSVWKALILGFTQGFTEFLPVSSSGHLVLLQRIFNIGGEVVAFDVLLHLASLLAVFSVMYKEIWQLIKKPFSPPMYKLLLATIPAVIIGVLFNDFLEDTFGGGYLGFGFLLTAGFLIITNVASSKKAKSLLHTEVNYPQSVIMGVAQGIAIIPGISRSGTTIFAGVVCGAGKTVAVKFSFLMSIPVILGSAIIKLPDLHGSGIAILPLMTGFFAALISAMLSIRLMLRLVKKHSFTGFAVYLVLIGLFLIINEYFLFLF